MAFDHGCSSLGSIPHGAHGHDDPDHRCVPCSRNRPRSEACRGRKPCHMVTLSPSMVRQAYRTSCARSAPRQIRSWFDKLTTNGIFGELTTNGAVGELTTNGAVGELTTNGGIRCCSWFDRLTTNGVAGELATSGNPFPALRRPFFNAHAGQGRNLITTTISAACAYNCDSIGSQPSTTTSSLRIRLASGSVPKTSGGASDQSSQRKRPSPSRYTQ